MSMNFQFDLIWTLLNLALGGFNIWFARHQITQLRMEKARGEKDFKEFATMGREELVSLWMYLVKHDSHGSPHQFRRLCGYLAIRWVKDWEQEHGPLQ